MQLDVSQRKLILKGNIIYKNAVEKEAPRIDSNRHNSSSEYDSSEIDRQDTSEEIDNVDDNAMNCFVGSQCLVEEDRVMGQKRRNPQQLDHRRSDDSNQQSLNREDPIIVVENSARSEDKGSRECKGKNVQRSR